MSNKKDLSEFAFFESLQKYLTTRIETSRGVTNISEEERGPLRPRQSRYKIVQYDCHDIKVTVSNTAPTEPEFPAVIFMGLALFVNFKNNEENILKRWHDERLPKIEQKYAPQYSKTVNTLPRNYFPRGNKEYFPIITEDERSHGYYLLPGQHIVYEMNVLLAECLDLNDMKLWVEGTVSRRHLYHISKEVRLENG